MKRLYFLLLMYAVVWQPALCEPAVYLCPLTEDIAGTYLGEPWVSHPLAEGSSRGVDCTTYVEETLAKRYANPDIALNCIRYRDGVIDFFNRNHFMEEMWIPNALEHGIIAQISLPDAAESLMETDLAEWYRGNPEIKEKDAAYYSRANAQKPFTVSIPYIQSARINDELLEKLPEETVVFFLRRYPEATYRWLLSKNTIMVTHMGFLFGRRRLYHASSEQKQVTKEDFSGYLQNHSSVCGAAFYEIVKDDMSSLK